jgi:hypothetical protein
MLQNASALWNRRGHVEEEVRCQKDERNDTIINSLFQNVVNHYNNDESSKPISVRAQQETPVVPAYPSSDQLQFLTLKMQGPGFYGAKNLGLSRV